MINDNNLLVRKGVLNHSVFFLYKFLLEKQQSDSSVKYAAWMQVSFNG